MKNFIKYTTISSIVIVSSILLLKKLKSENENKSVNDNETDKVDKVDKVDKTEKIDGRPQGIVIKPKTTKNNDTLNIVNSIRLKKGLPPVDENYNELKNDDDVKPPYFSNYRPKFYYQSNKMKG